MDDLEVNPLHKAFVTKFRREFEIACKKSYVIAIPKSETLENHRIDVFFANSHILIPSKLLRSHYNPSQVGNFDDIEMDNKKLICHKSSRGATSRPTSRDERRIIIRILAEEIGYNVYGKDYRIILISEPLAASSQQSPMALSLRGILSPRSPSLAARKRRAHLISSRLLANHDDCSKYLEFISHELTTNLENDVKRFQSNYTILSHYLEDAAERTRRLAESYIDKYEHALGLGGVFEVCDTIRRSLRLSVENYIVHLMHGKLLAALQSKHTRKERLLVKRFDAVLASRLSLCQLGAQEDFSDFTLTDDLMKLLRRLPTLQSPLAMVSCLTKVVELISDALNQSVKFKRMLGYGEHEATSSSSSALVSASLDGLEAPVAICSDDLIASFVFCLPRARPSNLYSALRYLESFGWSATERDLIAYYLATFESAIEHILQFSSQAAATNEEVATSHSYCS